MARKWTEEQKRAQSERMTGNAHGAWAKGFKRTGETKIRMSEAKLGKPGNNWGKVHVPGGWRLNKQARHILADGRHRGITLTLEQVQALLQLPCHYCGQRPDWGPKWYVTPGTGICRTAARSIGLDRKDSSLRPGYTPENVVTCCIHCNSCKGDEPYESYVARHPVQ